jgi:hypothetical protein
MDNMKQEVQAVTPRNVEHQPVKFQAAEETIKGSKATKLVQENALIRADACSKSNFKAYAPTV